MPDPPYDTPVDASAAYREWLDRQPLSPNTRRAYRARVADFCSHLTSTPSEYGDPLRDPHARDYAARDYKSHLKTTRRAKPSSVNLALAAIEHFYRFLGLGAPDVRREDLPKAAPQGLEPLKQKRFKRAVERSLSVRDRAIATLFLYTGLRLGELAALDLDDVPPRAGRQRYGDGRRNRRAQEAGNHAPLQPAVCRGPGGRDGAAQGRLLVPARFLMDAEWERLSSFPPEIPVEDLIGYYTLLEADLERVRDRRGGHNLLGYGLALETLRHLGYCPDDLSQAPAEAVRYMADQLGVDPSVLPMYAGRSQTRTDHLREIQEYLDYRNADEEELESLLAWLVERALEHDKPTLLLGLACEKLRADRVGRPGLSRLERLVGTARERAVRVRVIVVSFSDNRFVLCAKLRLTGASGRWCRGISVFPAPSRRSSSPPEGSLCRLPAYRLALD